MAACYFALVFGGCSRTTLESTQVLGEAGRDAVQRGTIVTRIGSLLGDSGPAFGRISDAALGDGGEIIVVDDVSLELSWFSASGELLGSTHGTELLGSPFTAPTRVRAGPAGRVAVLDAEARQIVVLQIEGASFSLLLRVAIHDGAVDFCWLNDRWYVLVPNRAYAISVFDDRSEAVDSVPLPQPSEVDPPAEAMIGDLPWPWQEGRLLCDPALPSLIFVPRYFPGVLGLNLRGEVVWRFLVPEYRPRRWQFENREGRLRTRSFVDPAVGFSHETSNATLIDQDHLAMTMQAQRVDDLYSELPETRIVSIRNHTELGRIYHRGSVFGVEGSRTYLFKNLGRSEVLVLLVNPQWDRPAQR